MRSPMRADARLAAIVSASVDGRPEKTSPMVSPDCRTWITKTRATATTVAPTSSQTRFTQRFYGVTRETFTTLMGGVSFWASVLMVRFADEGAC